MFRVRVSCVVRFDSVGRRLRRYALFRRKPDENFLSVYRPAKTSNISNLSVLHRRYGDACAILQQRTTARLVA
jgi:hypothetical protein